MKTFVKYVVVPILTLAALLYAGAGATLYATQRDIIYQPSQALVGAPPAGSIYRVLPVEAPTGGRLTAWEAPAVRVQAPTNVFFHGNASNVTDFAETGVRFHALGWGVVLGAYRGYSGNDGEPSEEGLFEDARAILAALSADGPVILCGHRLGSGVAAQMAAEGRGDALVLESPFTSLAAVGAMLYPAFPIGLLLTERFDTLSLIPEIGMPVLIVHSRDDRVVPFGLGESLARSFGEKAEFVPLDNLGHYPHQADLSGTVADWVRAIGLDR